MQFVSPLSTAAWIALGCVPLAIIALYFLKLRRRPVQIPSTLLWRRSLEDLHVNSLFQRLRRNLLLFLQLLAVGLAMLALAGPRLRGTTTQGQRYILLIDRSASMNATDVEPTRLERARAEAKKIIDAMESDDLAMIIAFADRAQVVSNYTSNRSLLQQRLKSIEPGEGTTSLRDVLQVAAGLANPSSDLYARGLPQGVVATRARIPPKLMIFTDGGFPDVEGFSVGNLDPEVVVIGPAPPAYEPPATATAGTNASPTSSATNSSDNIAILALQAARNEERPDQFQVFGRIHNYRDQPVATRARLLRHDLSDPQAKPTLIDTIELALPPFEDKAFEFNLPEVGSIALEVVVDEKDALELDNHAYAVYGQPRQARVLLVTEQDRYLLDSLETSAASKLAEVAQMTPQQVATDEVKRELLAGRFDLVIFDNTSPQEPPAANALYFGALPPGQAFASPRTVEGPVVLDWDIAHPLLQYIRDLNLIRILKAQVIDLPPGATPLIESNLGTLAFVAPRAGGYTDTVVGFSLLDGKNFNTDWPIRSYSFPLFLYNALRFLGNASETTGDESYRPGQPLQLRADATTNRLRITNVDGRSEDLTRNPQGAFVYTGTTRTGIYRATDEQDNPARNFAVNLFDPRESDLAPRGMVPAGTPADKAEDYRIKIGYTPLKGTSRSEPVIKDWWKPLALLALGIILLEWYIYNRRVYV